ncbi:MAG: peptide chain release factor N(5)-glutamine methyltransferase [Thermosynechococcaceae cyanobacterium MS004]|nr:peptide chain release factor N(5)-glutamine methyltransferase [Thermosynechococcaceae cyanobacterium MS004]
MQREVQREVQRERQQLVVSGEELWVWRQQAIQRTIDWVAETQVQPGVQGRCQGSDQSQRLRPESLLPEQQSDYQSNYQPDYLQELDWLVRSVTGLDRLALRLESFRSSPGIELTRSLSELSHLWQQRLEQRVPLQYLLGSTTWRDFSLAVKPGVLIPRPETELLIDLAQDWVAKHPMLDRDSVMQWADLGTGSGAIALGLSRSFPQAHVHGVDVSPVALGVAQHNARQLGLDEAVHFYEGEWLTPLGALKGKLDGIISNPPYIPSAEVPELQTEVALHEPHLALDGGEDGLASIRLIVSQAPQYLRAGGLLLLEMMDGQAAAVQELILSSGTYSTVQIHSDLAGVRRFASAQFAGG